MTFCQVCEKDTHPVVDFRADGRFVQQCPSCQMPLDAAEDTGLAELPPPEPRATAAPARPVAKPSGEPTTWGSIVDQARVRLAFCEEQIAARDGFIAERDMLRKMLAAAEGETKPAEREARPLN